MALYIEGKSDIGYECLLNQDYIIAETLNEDKTFTDDYLIGVIDGNGASLLNEQDPNMVIQPSKIVANTIKNILRRAYSKHKKSFLADPYPFLEMALISANTAIGAAKMTHEELYGTFSAACTIAFVHKNKIVGVHCGNTRGYVLRENKKTKAPQLIQLTKDHTEAQDLLDAGKISAQDFYTAPGLYTLTSALGVFADPKVQKINYDLKEEELFLLSTDGLFYAVPEARIIEQILSNNTTADTIEGLIKDVINTQHTDNIGMVIAFNVADEELEKSREKNNYYKENQ